MGLPIYCNQEHFWGFFGSRNSNFVLVVQFNPVLTFKSNTAVAYRSQLGQFLRCGMLFITISNKSSPIVLSFSATYYKYAKIYLEHKQITVCSLVVQWMAIIGSPCSQMYFRRHQLHNTVYIHVTENYSGFFRINLDTKLQFGNVYHCGQKTAIHLNQLSQKSHCRRHYCSHRCCHLCSHEVWADEARAAEPECSELVGIFHSWIPNHGQWPTMGDGCSSKS